MRRRATICNFFVTRYRAIWPLLACRVRPRLSVYGKVEINLLALVHGVCVAQEESSLNSLPAIRLAGLQQSGPLLHFAWHHLVMCAGANTPPSVHARSATCDFPLHRCMAEGH